MATRVSRTWKPRSPEASGLPPVREARARSRTPRPRSAYDAGDRDGLPHRSVIDGGERRGPGDLDVAGEHVRIGDDHGRLGAGDLDVAHPGQRGVEAEHALADAAVDEPGDRRHVGGDLDVEDGSGPVTGLDRPGGPALGADRRDTGHRSEELNQGGQVVRADVEQRTGTGAEQELRAGVEDIGADVLDHGLR